MDYIPHIAIAAGGIWTGYLVGQFVNLKNTNIQLNVQAVELTKLRKELALYKPERDTNGKFTSKKARVTAELQAYVASKKAVQ